VSALPANQEFAIVPAPTTEWLVLRCAAPVTLRLADSLKGAGIEAWTPVHDGAPLVARYVFARGVHLSELLRLIHNPFMTYLVWDAELRRMVARGHPYFRLMPSLESGRDWALVRDAHLNALRAIEGRRKPRGAVKAIPVGTTVRLLEGGFAGLDGVVQSVRKKVAMVSFKGFPMPIEVGCWLLTEKVDTAPGNH
jgi:transcription antitermination factor NusG